MNTNDEITKCEEDTNKVMNEVKNLRLSDSSDDKNMMTIARDDGSTSGKPKCDVQRYSVSFLLELRYKCKAISDDLWFKLVDFKILAISGARPKVRHQFAAVRRTYLSKLHLDMLMDDDLQRVVTKYEEIRNRRSAAAEEPTSSLWFPKDSEWAQKTPTTSAAIKRGDYLQDLVKNNQPGPIAGPFKEDRVTREAKAKAEQLKKQIQENIKVINEKFKDLKLSKPKPEPVRRRSESQSSSSNNSKKKKKKNSREKPVKVQEQLQPQKPLTINNAPLSKEENLMLSLLSLQCPLEREQYLIKVAKERSILQRNPLNNVLVLNSRYGGIFPIIKERAQQNIEQMSPCVLQINGVQKKVERKVERKARNSISNTPSTSNDRKGMVNGQASEETKKKKFKADSIKKELSYQDQVMQIVNAVEELPKDPFALKYYFNMPKHPSNATISQEHIDKFVSKLVSEGAGHIHKGDIRINSKNYGQAFVCDKETRDVFIGTPCLRRYALHGDIVEIYVHHGVEVEVPVTETLNDSSANEENGLLVEGAVVASKPRKLGFVTRIVEKKHNRTCIGTFSEKFSKETKSARFVPRDAKMPIINIPKQNWPNALLLEDSKDVEKVVYLAEIIEWKGEKAIGNILKPLGKCGELEVENEAILVQNHLDITPFSEEIINQLPKSPFIIPPEEFQKRTDLRKTTIFTIDPLTARDLDDALSCRRLDNGNYEIAVHISDVTYFLKEGSDLDNLVKEKATTIYMVDNVYHMLPKPLCFLCSLLPGEDKLAFSVFWEMKEDATIVSTRFARTIINSCTQFAYEHAQKIIDLPEGATLDAKDFPEIMNGVTLSEIQDIIKVLRKLALKLREKRMKNGALKIDQPKLSFRLDPETGKPVSYGVYELKEANRMIEDWMLLANCTVAAYIFKYDQYRSILRNHAPPSDNSMDNLEGTLKKYNYILNGRSSTELRDTMEQIIASSGSPAGARTVMNVLLSKPMQRAKYFCSGTATQIGDFHHFALAVKIYTHFTSPIRRYADVMVHRTLAGVLQYSPPSERTTEELQSLANICNMQKFNAKNAGDESSDLYFRTYLNSVGSIKTRAAVIALGVYSCEVVLMETGQSVKIFYKSLEPNTFVKVYDGEKITKVLMFWPKEVEKVQQRIITIFSELGVELSTQKMKLAINRVFPQ